MITPQLSPETIAADVAAEKKYPIGTMVRDTISGLAGTVESHVKNVVYGMKVREKPYVIVRHPDGTNDYLADQLQIINE